MITLGSESVSEEADMKMSLLGSKLGGKGGGRGPRAWSPRKLLNYLTNY